MSQALQPKARSFYNRGLCSNNSRVNVRTRQQQHVPVKSAECTHGQRQSILECEYSPSHHSKRPLTPAQIRNEFVFTNAKSQRSNVNSAMAQLHNVNYHPGIMLCEMNVPYPASASTRLDMYGVDKLTTINQRPLVALVHGGFWTEGSRQLFGAPVQQLVQAGLVVAAVGYDLVPAVTIQQQIAQISDALAWLDSLCAGCSSLLFVLAHGTGVHLVTMAMCRDMYLPRLSGVFLLSGVYDLIPLLHTNLAKHAHFDECTAVDCSVVPYNVDTFREQSAHVAVFVLVAEHDSATFTRNSLHFYNHIRIRPIQTHFMVAAGKDHYSIVTEMSNPNDAVLGALLQFVSETVTKYNMYH